MLRIDQLPSDTYIAIMAALELEAIRAESDAKEPGAVAMGTDVHWRKTAKDCREAKALLESHRYPRLAELAAVAS